MQIYPAIDIIDGKCVRLVQGKFDAKTVYGDNPAKVAADWERMGATFIHIVDLDGARKGCGHNISTIEEILKSVSVPIQVGGGIRTMQDIERMLNLGVSRVILGTTAIKSPETVKEAVEKFGDKIAVGVDAVNGKVAISGWEETSSCSALDICKEMSAMGIKTIIYTDISKDGMMSGPNVEATEELVKAIGDKTNIIASGGVSSTADLDALKTIKVHGAIVGKALYTNALKLDEIIKNYELS